MQETTAPRKAMPLHRAALRGAGFGLAACLVMFLVHSFVGDNLHVVVEGDIYRASQMSSSTLEKVVRRHGIRTVVNLRGPCLDLPWYWEECRTTARLGVSQEDLTFGAGHLPSVDEIHRLVEILDRSEYPILFHCYRGVDRTGLASTLALLLKTDTPYAQARRSLGLRYLHLPFGKTGHLDLFFAEYEDWLKKNGVAHDPKRIRHWVMNEYRGGRCSARIELLGLIASSCGGIEPVPPAELPLGPNERRPVAVPRDTPFGLRVRCTNTSNESWTFHRNDNVGVHAMWTMQTPEGVPIGMGRAGLIDARVPPGGSIDLTLALPPIKSPGRHRVRVGMIDEQHCTFSEITHTLLDLDLEVP